MSNVHKESQNNQKEKWSILDFLTFKHFIELVVKTQIYRTNSLPGNSFSFHLLAEVRVWRGWSQLHYIKKTWLLRQVIFNQIEKKRFSTSTQSLENRSKYIKQTVLQEGIRKSCYNRQLRVKYCSIGT